MKWVCVSVMLFLVGPAVGADERAIAVPYRLTDTKHVLVRAKLNGRGPYHFILDTGSPALFIAKDVAKQLAVEAEDDGWATLQRIELEGGLIVENAKGRIDDPYQIQAMNRLGLAGVELHGIIGYNILARYRIELDFTRPKMMWTPLNFDPPLPKINPAKGANDGLANVAQLAAMFIDKKADFRVQPRGFLGVELHDDDKGVQIKAVLPDSPASKAGLRVGDRLIAFDGQQVRQAADMRRRADQLAEAEPVTLTVRRGTTTHEITVTLGKGL